MFNWMRRITPLPPCAKHFEDLTAPRSETAQEPFDAGFEDRMEGRSMSTHRGIHYMPCGCNRCREYRAGYEFADKKRMKMLRKRHERRMYCYAIERTMQGRTAEDVAKSLGWDCFKEER